MNINSTHTRSNHPSRSFIFLTSFMLFTLLLCLIINFAVSRSINWSLYPIGGLIIIWSTLVPLLLQAKYKFSLSFAAFFISIVSYLFLLQGLVAEKGWLLPLALPIALLSLAALGISLFVYNRVTKNKLYAAAITMFLFGVIVNGGTGIIISSFVKDVHAGDVSRVYTIGASAIIALLLVVAGYIKNNRMHSQVNVMK